MDALEVLDFDFSGSQLVSKVIIKSDCMRETFSELDVTSDVLEVATVPAPAPHPRLRLTTYGFTGTTHFDFPRDSDTVEVFECSTSDPYLARYRLSLLRPATNRALALSSRVSLRMNQKGFLSLQYMIPAASAGDSQASFVEFFVSLFLAATDLPAKKSFRFTNKNLHSRSESFLQYVRRKKLSKNIFCKPFMRGFLKRYY